MRNSRTASRTDEQGRAFAGSQRWIQQWVNYRAAALNALIAAALPDSGLEAGGLKWVSPLESAAFKEYRDEDFLRQLELGALVEDLRRFWPAGGPCWDALARCNDGGGVVLVEAKSYPREMLSAGCLAGRGSRERIDRALQAAKRWLGARADSDWMGPAYQTANRLAHLYFLREVAGVRAWLVNVCFVDDPRSPTTRPEWEQAGQEVLALLGLEGARLPHVATVFPEAQESA
jgi:hypothetical protein